MAQPVSNVNSWQNKTSIVSPPPYVCVMPGVYVVLYLFWDRGSLNLEPTWLGWLAGPCVLKGCFSFLPSSTGVSDFHRGWKITQLKALTRVPMLVWQIFYRPSHFPSSWVCFDSFLFYSFLIQKFSLEIAEPTYSRNSFLSLPPQTPFFRWGRWASNSQFSCLSILSSGITGVHGHAQLWNSLWDLNS